MSGSPSSISEHQASSSSPSTGSKRRHDDAETTSQTPKRQKTFEADLRKEALHAAKVVQDNLPTMQKGLDRVYGSRHDPKVIQTLNETLGLWHIATNEALLGHSFNRDFFNSRLVAPEGATQVLCNLFRCVNDEYATFCDLQRKLLDALPPPSEFSKPSVWPAMQAGYDAILCLRPTEKRGLPLSILHDVFRKFRLRLNTPLPEGSAAGPALRAATVLCREMGEPFENELERSEKFDECVQELFSPWKPFYIVKAFSEGHSGMTGEFLWLDGDIPGAIREVKWEAGLGGGDIYLQIARRFDIAINNLCDRAKDNAKVAAFLLHGAPMFLMCLLGPIFFVAGGFFDGSSVVVEPLGQPCFMLMDETDQREQELARLLYAVEQGLHELKSVSRRCPSVDFLPGLPRIYSSCVLFAQAAIGSLTFHRRLSQKSQCLLFCATLSHPSPTSPPSTPIQSSVVVKLVNKRYGEDVHRSLASRGFAPVLYGYSRLDGAPTAYVMEYLGSDWMSLFEFERGVGAGIFKDAASSKDTQAALKNAIRTTLDEILAFMAKEDIVHGDLRPNNIMMQVDEETKPVPSRAGAEANLKVIDFDWGGKAGQVFYPERRNEDIESWPACAGSSIDAGHDRRMVDSWWPAFLAAR